MTANEHEEDSPTASVKVYVTSVLPMSKKFPGLCVDDSVKALSSVAVGGVQVARTAWLTLVVKNTSLGQPVISGGVLSTIR